MEANYAKWLKNINTATVLATASLFGCDPAPIESNNKPAPGLHYSHDKSDTLCGMPHAAPDSLALESTSTTSSIAKWREYPAAINQALGSAPSFLKNEQVELSPHKINAFVFADTRCPMARRYVAKLNALQAEFGKDLDLQVIAIFSKKDESAESITAFATELGANFPVMLDVNARVADAMFVERSPEVFVLDSQLLICYRGAIDDQESIRGSRAKLRNDYLRDAIVDLGSNKLHTPRVTETEGCFIERPGLPKIYPTWADDIAHLVEKHCASCHNEQDIGSVLPLTSYDQFMNASRTAMERIDAGIMPPWLASGERDFFQHDRRLDANEIWAIKTWLREGAPRGEGDATIDPRKYTSDLHLTEWDLQIDMLDPKSEKPFYVVPANGAVPYQTFIAPYVFKEDVWLVSSEVVTLQPRSLHHISVFIISPDDSAPDAKLADSRIARMVAAKKFGIKPSEYDEVLRFYGHHLTRQINLAGFYAPGEGRTEISSDRGILIKKGSQLAFECHYVSIGTEVKDLSSIRLKFGDMPELADGLRVITRTGSPRLGQIQIEPNGTQTITKSFTLYADAALVGIRPHMHYRGKNYRCEIERPGENRETLITIPTWDVNWEKNYVPHERAKLPKGTKIHMTYSWDNTAENLNNPDPTQKVTFGTSIQHEMGLSWLSLIYENPEETAAAEILLQQELDRHPDE